MFNRWTGSMIILAATMALPWAAWPDYTMHARISYDAGGTMVKGAEDADWSHATLNTLVLSGDTLWVDKGGTTEIEFAGASFLRMADSSKVEVTSMPPNGLVRGWEGSFYLQRLNRSTGDFSLASPACTIMVDKDTAVRVDVLDTGTTTVSVRWGHVSVRTDAGGDTGLGEGERCWVDPGLLPSTPAVFDRGAEDALDRWNNDRAKHLAGGTTATSSPIPATEAVIGLSDLDGSGEWVTVESRPYWRPTVVTDYVPYRSGHWSFVCGVGHVWVEDYPFAYVTSHYGRWQYAPAYGWIWGYDPVWSPAWVATVHCGDYFMWAPVGFDYRPVVMSNSVFFDVGGVQFDFSVCSYVSTEYLIGYPRHICAPDRRFIDYVHHRQRDINIWNINLHDNVVHVPYDRPDRLMWDFRPPHPMRGPGAFDGGAPVSHRVRDLEHAMGRDRFARVEHTGDRGSRTPPPPGGPGGPGPRNIHFEAPPQGRAPSLYAHPVRTEGGSTNRRPMPDRGAESKPGRTEHPGDRGQGDRGPSERGDIRGRNSDTGPSAHGDDRREPQRTAPGGETRNGRNPRRDDAGRDATSTRDRGGRDAAPSGDGSRPRRGPADSSRIDTPPSRDGANSTEPHKPLWPPSSREPGSSNVPSRTESRTQRPTESPERGGRSSDRSFRPEDSGSSQSGPIAVDGGNRIIQRPSSRQTERPVTRSEQPQERRVPDARVERSVPETRVERRAPETLVERSAPERHVERSVPETRVERSVPETRVERSVPERRVEHSVPETRVERAAPSNPRPDSGGGRPSSDRGSSKDRR